MKNRERYDLEVYKRDTWDGVQITMTRSSDNGQTYIPIDLNNTNILMQVKINASDDTNVLELSTSNNTITIVNASNGIFKINPINIDLSAGMYYYDIQFTFTASEKVKTYIYGTFNVIQDVTQLS